MNKKQEIIHTALETLQLNEVGTYSALKYGGGECDATVELLLMGGAMERFCVEVKAIDRIQALRALQGSRKRTSLHHFLVTPYLSQALADECRRLGLNFIDTAGNAYIRVPGQLIWISGRPRPKARQVLHEQGALRTVNGLRVIFSLLIRPDLLNQSLREIAAQAGVALGSVGKVLEDLQAQGHLSAGKSVARRMLDPEALQQAWSQHYPVSLRHKLNPQRYSALKGWDASRSFAPQQAVWGGEVAAYRMDGYLKPAEATIYSWANRQSLMTEYRLRPDPAGDIEILDAFWKPLESGDALVAPPLLVYADLIASQDGRSREAAAKVWEQIPHA